MRTSHEEADVIIPQQVSIVAAAGSTCLKVICEDVDVFVLLCHFYFTENWTHDLYMENFAAEKSLVCIKSSVQRNQKIVPYLLSAHSFACDSVPSMFGVDKKTVTKALEKSRFGLVIMIRLKKTTCMKRKSLWQLATVVAVSHHQPIGR